MGTKFRRRKRILKLDNPYLKEFQDLGILSAKEEMKLFAEDRVKWEDNLKNHVNCFRKREELVRRYSWAIPNAESLEVITRYNPIIEIGAGTGYWAYLLRQMNVDVICYDAHPPHKSNVENHWHKEKESWTEVIEGSAEEIKNHPDRTLFLCWPPYAHELATKCLNHYQGKYLLYVGESCGGCTGWDDRLDNQWKIIHEEAIPQWYGIHDYLFIFEKQ